VGEVGKDRPYTSVETHIFRRILIAPPGGLAGHDRRPIWACNGRSSQIRTLGVGLLVAAAIVEHDVQELGGRDIGLSYCLA